MKKPAKKPKTEDPEQSRRFLEAAREIEADGGLSPTDAEVLVESTIRAIAMNGPNPGIPD